MDVRLEPCTDRDLRHLRRWVDSPELLAFWAGPSFRWPLTRGQLRRYLHDSRQPYSRRRVYRTVEARTGEWVGHLDLSDIDQRRGTAWIGRVLVGDPALRSHGIGAAMIGQVLDVAFDELRLTRVELHVAEINDRARRCYSGLGFVYCGVADRYSYVGDTVCALLRMAVERPVWEARRNGRAPDGTLRGAAAFAQDGPAGGHHSPAAVPAGRAQHGPAGVVVHDDPAGSAHSGAPGIVEDGPPGVVHDGPAASTPPTSTPS
jgi:RimJ/RimL family protein N-acetyltransferase